MSPGDLNSTASGLLGATRGIQATTQGAVDLLGRIAGGSFWSQLRPASFRGVPFGVIGGTARFGRRTAVHEYPFRDTPWVEDLGRATRRILLTGFLVGDNVIAQRTRLIAACEEPGQGDLIHPTLGLRKVVLSDVSIVEHGEQGRVFEVSFHFIEQGQRLYPQIKTAAGGDVASAAGAVDASSLAAFAHKALGVLQYGASIANEAAGIALQWAERVTQVVNDATSLLRLVAGLPGQFGRVLGLSANIDARQILKTLSDVTLQDLTGRAAFAREGASIATGKLKASGAALGPSTAAAFGASAQALAGVVLAAAPSPGDALRGLGKLAAFGGPTQATGPALELHDATGDLCRRAAVSAMASAAAAYRPASSDDAETVRAQVLGSLDVEITVAGDQGEDAVFHALRVLRAAVVQALNAAGAGLPSLRQVSTPQPMPSLALAQRLYRDPARADELVARAATRHPAFMPQVFQALGT